MEVFSSKTDRGLTANIGEGNNTAQQDMDEKLFAQIKVWKSLYT